ncbi:MAG TPA: tetratricopeptide repeat protein [Kofleriaceae bacterium]|jgi:tetratricopeptide (TPR) repeat protein
MRLERALPLMLALALVVGAGGAPALAQDSDLAKAKAEMAKLDYDAAIALLEQAEASGKNQLADMIEIYRAMAESHAAMGRTDAAETAFRRLLALDPSVELPAGSSPKLTGPFTGAREFLAKRRIAVECRRGAADAATMVVQSDPVDLVAGARLVTGDGRTVGDDARGQGRVALAIPGGTSPAGCAALDRHGNVLARADLSATPEEGAPDEGAGGATGGGVVDTAPTDDRSRPIYARWWLYAGLGAAAGGVALYYGLKVNQAEDDLEDLHRQTMEPDHMITYADALAVEDRGERYARNANIALVVTGVFAAVSGGLLVHQIVTDRSQGRDEGEPALGAAPLPGGAAVNLTLGF